MTRPDPMADGTLAALAKRVEAEPASVELWIVIYTMLRPNDESPDAGRFAMLVLAGAYLDAADMLRPVGWDIYRIYCIGDEAQVILCRQVDGPSLTLFDAMSNVKGLAAEARARLAAALRARDAGGA